MMQKKKQAVLAWFTALLWMGLIFSLSAQLAEESAELSRGMTEAVVRVVAAVFDVEVDVGTGSTFALYHTMVRKAAHGALYFMLAVLVLYALRQTGVWGSRGFGLAFLICVLYAITDEIHQLYVPGRSGQVTDVLIDSAGVVLGLGVFFLAELLIISRRKRKQVAVREC